MPKRNFSNYFIRNKLQQLLNFLKKKKISMDL